MPAVNAIVEVMELIRISVAAEVGVNGLMAPDAFLEN